MVRLNVRISTWALFLVLVVGALAAEAKFDVCADLPSGACVAEAATGPNLSRTPTPTPTPLPARPLPRPAMGSGGGGVPLTGDCDGSGTVTIDELVTGINIALGVQPLARCAIFDADGDGTVTVDELLQAVAIALGEAPGPAPVSFSSSSPANGEGGVAVTRETILRFSGALAASSLSADSIFAGFGGTRLAARMHLAADGRTVSLFYQGPLPAGARVRVTIDGGRLRGSDGRGVDANRDGRNGGVGLVDFDTLALTTLPGTSVCGRVFASEIARGDGGASVNAPLAGVTITVDGMEEELRALTDQFGNFRLEPAPAGRFFVHIDGRTATRDVPPGAYYPFVGKAWQSVPGAETNVGEIFLPLIVAGTLQPVSATQDTRIGFPPSVLDGFPEFGDVSVMVPADSLYADDGRRGGMVGIAPVPPDRLPGTLPPGLNLPIVITVQTDGASNFDVPAPACFPNLPDTQTGQPLAAASASALWSFSHDTGRFEIVGAMRVSGDGRLICTDPGVGILAPGWHGSQPGVGAGGGPMFGPPPLPPFDCQECVGGCPICEPDPCPMCDLFCACQSCGDGLFCSNCGEECDEGEDNGGSQCTKDCKLPCDHPDSAGCSPPPGPDGDCQTSTCNPETGKCDREPTNAGGDCDVGNPCSFGGTCDDGGRCDSMPNDAGTCDDGQECTEGDHCEDGGCTGNPVPEGTRCCGDGMQEGGEQCDNGAANSDSTPDACRRDCQMAFCGDGVADSMGALGPEECDDGEAQNTGAPNACRPNCKEPFCGDNIVDTALGEECDLANDNSLTPNSCRPDCKNPRCGDGLRDDLFGETCDDGAGNSDSTPNACRQNCTRPRCGDGVLDGNEVCDDGNTNDGDGCNNDCIPECGNGAIDRGEECDDNNDTACDGCSATCRTERCGNGTVECTEQCDDGMANSDTTPGACRNDCTPPRCGDHVIDTPRGEQCDDGNNSAGDGCGPTCRIEECGNFALDPNEQCDDGNTIDDATCRADCSGIPTCPDGRVDSFLGEQCDDGNLVSGDGCEPDCRGSGVCPNGVVEGPEQCDDGNSVNDDGCESDCTSTPPNTCPDGTTQPPEQCDDGNSINGDGCESNCRFTPPPAAGVCGDGTQQSNEDCDDGNTVDDATCPANCLYDLTLEPALILGLGFCDLPNRPVRVTLDGNGADVTTDPDTEYFTVDPTSELGRRLQTAIDTLRNRAGVTGAIPIADIQVVGGEVVFNSPGINVLLARRRGTTLVSNPAFVLGDMELAEAKSLEIGPFTAFNAAVDTATFLINKALRNSKALEADLPMILLPGGPDCGSPIDDVLVRTGFTIVESLKFQFFGGELPDVDLMDVISGFLSIAPANTPLGWLARVAKIGAPVAVAQLLDFQVSSPETSGSKLEDDVIIVSDEFSASPPFIKGIVRAKAPGVSAVKAKLDLTDFCLGKAEDNMLVFVAPELRGADIRAESEIVEDPLVTPPAPAQRLVHAVGLFKLLAGLPKPVVKIDIENPTAQGVIEFADSLLPGGLKVNTGVVLPPGGFIDPQTGFFEGGDDFFELDATVALASKGFTVSITDVDIQTRLPNLVTEWEILPPLVAALDIAPNGIDTTRSIVGLTCGATDLVVDACIPFATPQTLSDINGIVVPCTSPACGDGVRNVAGETCERPGSAQPPPNGPNVCRSDCTYCGDGTLDMPAEQCDDGNQNAGDGCEPDCRLPFPAPGAPFCGDGNRDFGEACDPPGFPQPPHGNSCRPDCTYCGDGRVDAGEACDDGATLGACLPNCTFPPAPPTAPPTPTATPTAPPQCGDGVRQPPEQCDDGNTVDGDGCRNNCTLPVGAPLPGELCITEVVTDPRRDWSDSTGSAGLPFDRQPGPGAVTPGNPANEYVEIRNPTNRNLVLAGSFLRMNDTAPAMHPFGLGSATERYSAGASEFFFPPGAVVVVGNPAGEMDDEIYLALVDQTGALLADLEIGGNFASRNFEADDDGDGAVNEDGPNGLDNDGDMQVDEDGAFAPYRVDPVGDGAPGPGLDGRASGPQDEALHRVADTPLIRSIAGPPFEFPIDARNYARGPGTPGDAPPLPAQLTIDEIVTRPLRDWSDSNGPVGASFDEFPGPGPITIGDPRNEYVEIRNRGPVAVRVRDMVLQMNDATPETHRIGNPTGGTVERYTSPSFRPSPPSSADALQPGGTLVIGNPPGQMDDQIYLALVIPCAGTVSDVEIGGNTTATNFESDTDRDGAVDEDPLNGVDDDGDGVTDEDRIGPDPVGDGAPVQPAANVGEALRRVSDGVADAIGFRRGNGDPGRATGPQP